MTSETSFDMRRTTVEDIPSHMELMQSIPEFEGSSTSEQSMKRTIDRGTGRSYAIWEGDKMVSVVSTTAENTQSAMIVGVGTREDHKRKGYASELMIKICEELINEGKIICLFYDNPEAGKIYQRLGFKKIGLWNMNVY